MPCCKQNNAYKNFSREVVVLKKAIYKALEDMKNKCTFSISNGDHETTTMLCMLKEVEAISFNVFESLITFSGPRTKDSWLVISLQAERKMASSSNQKTGFHARSNSFPSRLNPVITQLDEHLCRSRASEGACTSSSLGGKLSSLQDLHDCVNKLLFLPLNQQAIVQENNGKLIEELLDGSLQVLDLCNTAKDALLQTKESVHELQSILRRRGCVETGLTIEVKKYLTSRKVAKRAIHRALKVIKKNCSFTAFNGDRENTIMFNMLKEVENTSKSDNIKGVQTQLENLELCIQVIEEGKMNHPVKLFSGYPQLLSLRYNLTREIEANVADLAQLSNAVSKLGMPCAQKAYVVVLTVGVGQRMIIAIIVTHLPNINVLRASNTVAEDQSNLHGGSAEQCGSQAGGALCPGGLCCSQFGWCGNTNDYCGTGCQSQCGGASGDLGSIISSAKFDEMLKHRNDGGCPGKGFYTYNAFISAANAFPGFGTTGNADTRKREIAAFLGQTSHETTGGWQTAPDGPYAWGYCFVKEQNPGSYCSPSSTYPCAGGKQYYGRGPVQLSWNYNYGQCGKAIGVDLLNNPDLVATDPVISFKTAIWFWMTAQSPKPSCHSVITGNWSPSGADSAAGRVPGYGVLTNIINGGLECGMGWKQQVEDRIGFYKRYCDLLGVGYGNNLDCYNQRSFANGLFDLVDSM
ncbi:hypothetical protein NC652_024033 [Populus alba x Populus x berolinensis]|nr:hypothetical protein NC652_024033 [Populus alba x Populus x berolinensis]